MHHATGVRESFQVQRQAASLRAAVKPFAERARVVGGQRRVALIQRQVDRRLRPQAAVEMIVQQDLGQRSNKGVAQLHKRPVWFVGRSRKTVPYRNSCVIPAAIGRSPARATLS